MKSTLMKTLVIASVVVLVQLKTMAASGTNDVKHVYVGKDYADAIQNQILAPMCKEEDCLNANKIAFAKVKPLLEYLRTVELLEEEKVFLAYIERYYQAGEKEPADVDLYKSVALEMFAPLIVKLERRNVQLPKDKVDVFKKWFYADALETKLIELRDRHWNMKARK